MQQQNIPDDLAELDRWAAWRAEGGKKIPYRVDGHRASTTSPNDWGELRHAQEALASGKFSGLAFAFFESDGLVGMDLDDCLLSDGGPKEAIMGLLQRFADTYCEISPGGCGLKFWCRGKLQRSMKVRLAEGVGMELYSMGRYFTFTGRRFRAAPLEVEDHSGDLKLMYTQLTEAKATSRWQLQPLEGGRIPYGQQHATLVSLAGTLRARRICDDGILACLLEINARQCERPGPREHIERIVRSSRNWGAA